MTSPIATRLADATRLTREGRLSEAMAAIRQALGTEATPSADAPAAAGPAPWSGPTLTLDAFAQGIREAGAAPIARRAGQAGPAPGPLRRAPAAAAAPDGARFEQRQFTGPSGSLGYKLYVPRAYDGRPLPLVVMLHGCTQSPDDFAAGTRMNEVAEEQGLLVAYPAQTSAANASRCWNWFKAGDQQRDRGEPALIAGVTRQIMGEFAVSPDRVYVAGLSAGGAAAATMGALYPELYAAIGIHSGLACGVARDLPSALTAMRQGGSPPRQGGSTLPPTIVFHGDQDRTVHPVNASQVVDQASPGDGAAGEIQRGETAGGVRYTRRIRMDARGVPQVESWEVHGLGHVWFGGSTSGSYAEARGPDASREMVRFFLQHRGKASA